MLHANQASLTIFPNHQVTQAIIFYHLRVDSARVNVEELDVSLRTIEGKMGNDLVSRRLGAAVAHGSRLVHL